jgi:hypothetical protein
MQPRISIVIVLALLVVAGTAAATTPPPLDLSFDAAAPPLVEFGAATTTTQTSTSTIDPDTRSLFDAFAAAEEQLQRAIASDGPPVAAAAADGNNANTHPKLSGLLTALEATRAKLNQELSDALDSKIFDRAGALRQRLGPKGMLRLIEEAQKARGSKCKAGAFTPPKMAAAKITGPGAFLSVAAPLCTIQRKALPLQVTLPIACTGAGVVLRETPALYSASALAGARATTRECKAERKWGPEGTAEVVLFDPKHLARQFGLLPADKFNNTGSSGGGADTFDEKKRAWKDGAADVKEAVKGLWGAMLGNVTVKDTPNGPSAWQEKMAAQAEAVREKFEALRGKMAGGGPHVVGKSDDDGGAGAAAAGNGTTTASASSRRREAELRLRALAAEYLEERLAAAMGDGGEEAAAPTTGATTTSARLAAALRDLAVGAVEEAAPPGLFEVQQRR